MESKQCARCGGMNDSEQIFCATCGSLLGYEAAGQSANVNLEWVLNLTAVRKHSLKAPLATGKLIVSGSSGVTFQTSSAAAATVPLERIYRLELNNKGMKKLMPQLLIVEANGDESVYTLTTQVTQETENKLRQLSRVLGR